MSSKVSDEELDKLYEEASDLLDRQDELRVKGMTIISKLIKDPKNLELAQQLDDVSAEMEKNIDRREELSSILRGINKEDNPTALN